MKAQVLRGTKQEIAETIARIPGEVREAVVFVGELSDPSGDLPGEDVFGEMEPFTVKTGGADYSREALYAPDPDC